MICFFILPDKRIVAVQTSVIFEEQEIAAISWLLGGASMGHPQAQWYIGPRKEMITPWSTTAVEITQNMNIRGISRMELFTEASGPDAPYDPMLQQRYKNLDEKVFFIDRKPEKVCHIADLKAYNVSEGLALSPSEIEYLESLSAKLGRPLTDSEVFGFSQVNSEHCRHKIFNGQFVIDGKVQEESLFGMIKKTSKKHPGRIVSAYKDNCAFLKGPEGNYYFSPEEADKPSNFGLQREDTVLALKAETHNFPTTVEPFNGAATGSGGEIRDRMAGGQGSYPLAGTAVYMTSYPRFGKTEERPWENTPERKWLYQTPNQILTKASNGASDFGNKFGQALICGSLLCFENQQDQQITGYDKVIMLAGGLGYAKLRDAEKQTPSVDDHVILLGGDNYRIGMGGGAVSSVDTGQYQSNIELNAVQRSNPEMQKRVFNTIRAMADRQINPIVSIHDHGAGGHLNCLSELVEETGGRVDISRLPVGDPTLSDKEIVGNESQERMGLVLHAEDVELMRRTAERERAPMYDIGRVTGDMRFTFDNSATGETPIDLALKDMFGSAPKTVMQDKHVKQHFTPIEISPNPCAKDLEDAVGKVLGLESVACKDWLTNKVDRSVSGLIARQQCSGELQLPLNDYGMTALSFHPASTGEDWKGMATSVGHAPIAALVDPAAGSRLSIAEALCNLAMVPIEGGLQSVSLSANWMWPCHNPGEDARLYDAVKAASDFAIDLEINIPTGKDSLSLTQKYPDGNKVLSPGTLIISSIAPVQDIRKAVGAVVQTEIDSAIVYIPFTQSPAALGATAFAQTLSLVGCDCADISCPSYFAKAFAFTQECLQKGIILAGHDVSSGGLATCLLEMCFANSRGGICADQDALLSLGDGNWYNALFAENPGLVIQVPSAALEQMTQMAQTRGLKTVVIGKPCKESYLKAGEMINWDIASMRRKWFRTSYLMDIAQSGEKKATERFTNFDKIPLEFSFPKNFTGKLDLNEGRRPQAAIIREKGSNGDREMAWMLYLAGFDVRDVHMTDLSSGREDLKDVQFIVFVGGFSNSDVLGSARGWAGAFLYNPKAKASIDAFYARKDTMSLGICNGCQLMATLGLITPQNRDRSPKILHNDSGKFESNFVNINITHSPSIMLEPLQGSRLGIWVAHGEGKFSFPEPIENYNIAAQYSYHCYPANPNGSPADVAGVCSPDGRHLAMMPHPERCIYPWNWALYPKDRNHDEVSPWVSMFIAAHNWCIINK